MNEERLAAEGDYVECINGSFGIVRDGMVEWFFQPNREHVHSEPGYLLSSTLARILTKEEIIFVLLER